MFYAPIEVKNASEVFYRETRNESIVKKATDQVRVSFVREKDFLATSAFIATWKNVAHADGKFPNKVKLPTKSVPRTTLQTLPAIKQITYVGREGC